MKGSDLIGADAANQQTRASLLWSSEEQRLERIRVALARADLAAVVCTLPTNVLLLSGYWPVVGTACAVIWRQGPALLILPADEQELAARWSWADEVRVLTGDIGTAAALSAPLRAAAESWGGDRIAVERGPSFEPASYASMCVYGASLWDVAALAWPGAQFVAANELLAELRAFHTRADLEMVGAACTFTAHAFERAPALIRPGVRETEIAAHIRAQFGFAALGPDDRADGYVYCMSGAQAAKASRAYARSSAKLTARGDFVLIHCNACVNGYWTDVTRTYCIGVPDDRQRTIYDAIFAARTAALGTIRPGAAARDVDRAAREVLSARGFAAAFRHATGHGVGFGAIDHDARPRVAPTSPDVLQSGMVCNIEPAVYLDGYGGARHCDVVVVTETGARVLTPFHASVSELTTQADGSADP